MNEFMEYWNSQDSNEIVSFLFDVDEKKLNEIIDVENSIDIDNENNFYEVIDVIYRYGKNRKNLIELLITFDENSNLKTEKKEVKNQLIRVIDIDIDNDKLLTHDMLTNLKKYIENLIITDF